MNNLLKRVSVICAFSSICLSSVSAYGADIKEIKISNNQNNNPKIGFVVNDDNSKSLIDGKGNYVASSWCKVGGKWYYFDENKKMKIGWANTDNKWYFLNNDGTMKTGWLSYNGKYYYLDNSGEMQTGWFKDTEGSNWYYADSNGEMLTGWQKINYKWYYFDESGHMAHDTYVGKYTLGHDGAML